MDKSLLVLDNKSGPAYPYYGTNKEKKEWNNKYKNYLNSLSHIDSLRFDYKMIRFSLQLSILIIFITGLIYFFTKKEISLILCIIAFFCTPFILLPFLKCKKEIKEHLKG